ncbi:unnamed protein product (macronuclear) [Paramecium tetraurelia]|uniref:Uncharacterized protein n=1 Tax=Paramecium tetraurelia TaxID=5888 RepID=A0D8C1_PARTE|nr:uncharacterized protein GSPATT00014255001 [Paramecium tetraurelia]CAK79288.1 unnamed protein product [Paramecium tetraurelia]|eukprot:XP_001446685.1 hypothetical protein (macronuclear) [Paramecium tetraurelia strain d4-2]
MGSICKQQAQQQIEIQNEVKFSKGSEKKDLLKRNTETSGGTQQQNSTKQFSVKKDPLSSYMNESLSDSDSDSQQSKPNQQVFTNFVTFQALPSQKQMIPKFEVLKDQFKNEMIQQMNMQHQRKQF